MKKIISIILIGFTLQVTAQNLQPTENLALVTVKVTNFKGIVSVGDKITFKSKKTGKQYSGTSSSNGMFQILLPKERFFVLIQGFETEQSENELVIPNVAGPINFSYTIRYELPKVYTLQDVNFDSGKNTIRADSFKSLDELAELMKRKRTMIIEFAGHTDNIGDDKANQKLSESRALSVKQYIVSKGVPAARISAVGYGASKPIASNESEEGRQKNRRTEVSILNE